MQVPSTINRVTAPKNRLSPQSEVSARQQAPVFPFCGKGVVTKMPIPIPRYMGMGLVAVTREYSNQRCFSILETVERQGERLRSLSFHTEKQLYGMDRRAKHTDGFEAEAGAHDNVEVLKVSTSTGVDAPFPNTSCSLYSPLTRVNLGSTSSTESDEMGLKRPTAPTSSSLKPQAHPSICPPITTQTYESVAPLHGLQRADPSPASQLIRGLPNDRMQSYNMVLPPLQQEPPHRSSPAIAPPLSNLPPEIAAFSITPLQAHTLHLQRFWSQPHPVAQSTSPAIVSPLFDTARESPVSRDEPFQDIFQAIPRPGVAVLACKSRTQKPASGSVQVERSSSSSPAHDRRATVSESSSQRIPKWPSMTRTPFSSTPDIPDVPVSAPMPDRDLTSCPDVAPNLVFASHSVYRCPHPSCHRAFTKQEYLNRHLSSHRVKESRRWACEVAGCNRTYVDKSSLVKHTRTHSSERPFVCATCQQSFVFLPHLRRHERRHTGEKPYKCTVEGCRRAFPRQDDLAHHRRQHTGERPYACPVEGCGATFVQATVLTRHLKMVHGL